MVCFCRSCRAPLTKVFADLGVSPIANAFLSADQLNKMEPFYPLRAFVCDRCFLVQLQDFERPENIFNDSYAYFSSYSDTWVAHARHYVEHISSRINLTEKSFVVEIASNDGYLLQFFLEKRVPVLGFEPSSNVADAARQKGIETCVAFFTRASAQKLAEERGKADLIIGNNVLAHVPELNDFVAGLQVLLRDDGVITMEFPHLLSLMQDGQFDTIYHEHFSYFSFIAVQNVFAVNQLQIFDVERLSTHGGSLRIYATHQGRPLKKASSVSALIDEELRFGLKNLEAYSDFSKKANRAKFGLLEFLIQAKREGKSVVGYGAPAKGNTLLNFCGIRQEFLDYTVDRSLHKQGLFLPGSHIPIYSPDRIKETRPDFVLILPWNLKDEISAQMSYIAGWGGKFVVPIPQVQVLQ